MITYYELLQDNTIGRTTQNEAIANQLELTLRTEQEIVYAYNGKRYFKGQEPPAPEKTYIEKRQAEYPSISDQLDMIYWDKINNTNYWIEKITEIKNKYPKV